MPDTFSLVEKTHAIWLIYVIHWDKVYIEPNVNDLVVSYKLYGNDNTVKTVRITVRDTEKSKNLRFFQSWKSATSDYVANYNADLILMSREFVHKLADEL